MLKMSSNKGRILHASPKQKMHNISNIQNIANKNGSYTVIPQIVEEKHVFYYKKLVVPGSMRSIYWKCYGFPANEDGKILTKVKIVCLLCKTVIAYNRNTSNLRMHLQNKHPEELSELEMNAPPRKQRLEIKDKRGVKRDKSLSESHMYSTDLDGTVEIGKHVHVVTDPNVTLEEFDTPQSIRVIVKDNSLTNRKSQNESVFVHDEHSDSIDEQDDRKSMESKTISDAIAEFIIMDLQLPDIVAQPGFQRLVATLRSPCEIPSKNCLVSDVIPKIYDTFKEMILENLKSAISDIALSIEEWESSGGNKYITISAHFQQQGCEDNLQSKVLMSLHCSSLIDENMWNCIIIDLLKKWHLKKGQIKAVIIATEINSLLASLKTFGFTLIPCLIYTMQNICMISCFELPAVKKVVTKIRTLLSRIFENPNILATFHIQEHLLQLDETPLAADFPKAWVSTYVMLEKLISRRNVIDFIMDSFEMDSFNKNTILLTDNDWNVIEDVVTVLEPFKVTTMSLAEEKAPLISLLKPLMWQIVYVHMKIIDTDSELAKTIKSNISRMLKVTYEAKLVNELLTTATTLDPRFKLLPYSAEETKETLNHPIKARLIKIIEKNDTQSETEGQTPSKKSRLSGMEFLLGEVCLSSNAISIRERAELEISQYQSEPAANLYHCPLSWWQISATKFKNLSQIAACYNCIPATAYPTSRIPVDIQIMFDQKRANLTPDLIDKLLFLNANNNL